MYLSTNLLFVFQIAQPAVDVSVWDHLLRLRGLQRAPRLKFLRAATTLL
jgi:hypothetical protein